MFLCFITNYSFGKVAVKLNLNSEKQIKIKIIANWVKKIKHALSLLTR